MATPRRLITVTLVPEPLLSLPCLYQSDWLALVAVAGAVPLSLLMQRRVHAETQISVLAS